MNFINLLKNENKMTTTTNGAKALKSTDNHLVDLFGMVGASRNRSENEIINQFIKAYDEDPLLALKMVFYARDIRGGLGERRTGRILFKYLAEHHTEVMKRNLHLMSHYGRWDDLWILLETPLKKDVLQIVKEQLKEDVFSEKPSLLGKWLPSINASSKTTKKYAKIISKSMNLTEKSYRHMLTNLRHRINVVESKMSANKWYEINYEGVPSKAMNNYRKAFNRNDEERFEEYLMGLQNGTKKVNASTLFPYEIVEKMLYSGEVNNDVILEQQWKALPDFIEDSKEDIFIMADVSGSMTGRPMATAIGLAIYFAEKSQGAFKGHYMTFSETPEIIKLKGDTITEKVNHVARSPWGYSTNLESALALILQTAVNNKVAKSQLPTTLIIVTDMQFNQSASGVKPSWTFYDEMKNMYLKEGYRIPNIVFWNVNSPLDTYQSDFQCEGIQMVSGQSTSIFKSILNANCSTPFDFMKETLNVERYEQIAV